MLFFRSMPWYFIGCCLYHCLGCFLGYCSVYYLNYCQFVSHLVVLEAERLFSLVFSKDTKKVLSFLCEIISLDIQQECHFMM